MRLHNGNSLTAVPIFLPADEALKAKEVPARASFTRTFVRRPRDPPARAEVDAAGGADADRPTASSLLIALSLLLLLAWGLHRLGAPPAGGSEGAERSQRRTAPPAGAPTPAGQH